VIVSGVLLGGALGPDTAHTTSSPTPKTPLTATARRRQYTALVGSLMLER
jgi:hypothetical protein